MIVIRQFGSYLGLCLCLSSTAERSIKAEEVIPMLGCRACHGSSDKGAQLGPGHAGISQRMTRGELHRTLVSRDDTDNERHMLIYDYLSEGEVQQLLDVLEQQ